MINYSDEPSRRILTLPAIRPCESISLTTLLTSLINLLYTLSSFQSKSLYTNKQNAKRIILLSQNLLIILQEIKPEKGCSNVSSSVLLSLSELQFIFQKVKYLLEDCKRESGRILMLVNAELVANQFQVLMREIAVALDVLFPLDHLLDDSVEVKELEELVRSQAWKARFEVEKNDKLGLEKVFRALSRFEEQNVPELSDLRWVMFHLKIMNWSECNNEVKFLKAEIGLEGLTKDKREIGVLSSLLGFMIYCRCTLFDVVLGEKSTRQSVCVCRSEVIKCLNLDDFLCPISLEIMTDPVTISTGHTYDRSSILKWFSGGNFTCPKTGEKVICTDLVPNLALKLLIKQYCLDNGFQFVECTQNRDPTKTVCAGNVKFADKAMKMVAEFLVGRLVDGPSDQKNKAAYEICLITKSSVSNRFFLAETGAVPHLLHLLSNSSAQENAIAALLNLSKYVGSRSIMVENGALELIFDVFKYGQKMEARQHMAGGLFYLSSVEEYRIMIGEMPGIFQALIDLIREGMNRGKKAALVAIFGLLMSPENHRRVLAAGLVPLLLNLLPSFEREDLVTDSLAVLATLAETVDGTMALVCAGAVPKIVKTLNCSTLRATKEHCVSLLLALCINGGEDVVHVLLKNLSLMAPLYSLLMDGTSRASKKASSLIRILHSFNEKRSSGLMNQGLPPEQSIHVW